MVYSGNERSYVSPSLFKNRRDVDGLAECLFVLPIDGWDRAGRPSMYMHNT